MSIDGHPPKLQAPWDPLTVILLNTRQQIPWLHEYTCPNGCELKAGTLPVSERLVLVATPDGWICPGCSYRQDWAHHMDLRITLDSFIRNSQPIVTEV